MLAWIRKLRNTCSRSGPAPRTALVFEPLETREVPALFGLGANLGLNLGNTSVGVALLGSASTPSASGNTIGVTGLAQVSLALFQAPSTPSAPPPTTTPAPAPSTPSVGTASLSGVIRYSRFGGDEVGTVAGATVLLTDGDGNVVASTTTDANGNYVLGSLPAGTYTLSVVSPEFDTQERAVTLANGEATTQNFALTS